MGIFERLRDNILAGVGAIQGRPVRPVLPPNEFRTMPMPVEPGQPGFPITPGLPPRNGRDVLPPARPPAASPVSPWLAAKLDTFDFLGSGMPYRANEWFSLAVFRNPEDRQVRIATAERRLRMYVRGQLLVAGQNLAAAAARTVSLPHLVQTRQASVTLPATIHPEVAVWAVVGGTWTRLTITAVNYAAPSITFTEPAGIPTTANIEIYFVHGDGQFRFRVQRDLGAIDDAAATAFNGTFAAIHTLEQTSIEALMAWPNETNLVPGLRLALEVNTGAVPIVWNDRAGHQFFVFCKSRKIDVHDRSYLARHAELDARQNL